LVKIRNQLDLKPFQEDRRHESRIFNLCKCVAAAEKLPNHLSEQRR
jgi:hypothetical protein